MSAAKETVMNRLSCIGIGLLALGALAAAGCGGGESIESSASGLVTAPTALADLDLPGCEVLATRSARRWEMLAHPRNAELVVVTGDGCPVCVDTRDGAEVQLGHRLDQPVTLESLPAPGVDPSGDPAGESSGETDESQTSGEDTRTTVATATKRGMIADDPLPPPGNGRPALTVYTRKQ